MNGIFIFALLVYENVLQQGFCGTLGFNKTCSGVP